MTTGALAIQDNDTVVQYVATGESSFSFNFPILESDELKVSRNQVLLTFGLDYSITGLGDEGGGSITLLLGASTPGHVWTLWQDMPIERLTGFSAGAATILGAALNAEFAARLRVEQQLRREIRNSIRLAPDDPVPGQDMVLAPKATRAGKFHSYDADGKISYSNGTGNDAALRADLAKTTTASEGARLVGMKHTEAGAVGFSAYTRFRKSYYLRDFGAAGDGSTDDSAALKACYAACASAGRNMLIENGSYRYLLATMPTGLLWDQKVNVIGEDWELTKLLCDSDGPAVRVDNNSDFRHFEEFQIGRLNAHTGVGFDGWLISRINLRRLWVQGHTSHAFYFRGGNGPTVENCRAQLNGGDGLKIESFTGTAGQSVNGVTFKGVIDLISNGGWGINNQAGSSHHGGLLLLQNNVTGNARINDICNDLVMYLENPTSGIELQMTATGVRNRIVITNDSIVGGAGIQDATGNNVIVPLSLLAGVLSPYYGPGRVAASVAGRDCAFTGGNGGTGGGAAAGGRGFFTGGDAGGSAPAAGGDCVLDGGLGASGGGKGKIKLGGTGGAGISKHLSAVASLDFNLTATASQDLTIAVAGALVGDTVALGVANASMTADTLFYAWVSAADTVTVRAMRIAGTPNPGAGNFRVDVWQH